MPRADPMKICETCKSEYEPTVFWQRFCGTTCRMKDASKRRRIGVKLFRERSEAVARGELPPLSEAST